MRKEKSRSPPKLSNGRLPLILACLLLTCKNTDSQGCVNGLLTVSHKAGWRWRLVSQENISTR
ncbi:hypothetical protein GPK80_13690 [Coprococcus comes]|nr:hypothetical protein [Coprococcus comes]